MYLLHILCEMLLSMSSDHCGVFIAPPRAISTVHLEHGDAFAAREIPNLLIKEEGRRTCGNKKLYTAPLFYTSFYNKMDCFL